MKRFLGKFLLLLLAMTPFSAQAHLIGDHSVESTHSAFGLEHFILAVLVGVAGYLVFKAFNK